MMGSIAARLLSIALFSSFCFLVSRFKCVPGMETLVFPTSFVPRYPLSHTASLIVWACSSAASRVLESC